ncbi:MAG: tetratricopeptide repeat protein [Gemmatimonadetes bacterium]|nr:tetratricopeptide repeat protein [Gemmatimonadota bacterium]
MARDELQPSLPLLRFGTRKIPHPRGGGPLQREESPGQYERALRLNSLLGDDVYLKLGNLVYKDGDRDWALELWRKALELNPGNEVVRTNLELMSSAPGR